MNITDIKSSNILTIEKLKAYANIVGCEHDDELRSILRSAAIRVAQYADVALLGCTIVDDVYGGGEIQLWMPPVADDVTVKDIASGEDVTERCTRMGDRMILPETGNYTVTYSVEPTDATVEQYAPLVWQMAVAMWDGNTDEEQKVYRRIPAGYVVH